MSPKAAVNSSDGGRKDLQNVVLTYAYGVADQALTLQQGIPVLTAGPVSREPGAGVLLLAAGYDNGYWVSTPSGFRDTSKRQVPEAPKSFSSIKFAKALVGPVGASGAYDRIIGHRLELVPLTNPFAVRPGDILRVRVLFDGKPLVGAEVESGDGVTSMTEPAIPPFRTDENGVADVRIAERGPQLLVVDHRLPSAHPDLAAIDLYNATLSFLLP